MELHAPYGEIRATCTRRMRRGVCAAHGRDGTHAVPGKIVQVTVKKLVPPRRDAMDGSTGYVLVQLDPG